MFLCHTSKLKFNVLGLVFPKIFNEGTFYQQGIFYDSYRISECFLNSKWEGRFGVNEGRRWNCVPAADRKSGFWYLRVVGGVVNRLLLLPVLCSAKGLPDYLILWSLKTTPSSTGFKLMGILHREVPYNIIMSVREWVSQWLLSALYNSRCPILNG